MTNKTQVQGDVCFTDWITFQEGVNEGLFFKPLSAVWKLLRNWILLIFTQPLLRIISTRQFKNLSRA